MRLYDLDAPATEPLSELRRPHHRRARRQSQMHRLQLAWRSRTTSARSHARRVNTSVPSGSHAYHSNRTVSCPLFLGLSKDRAENGGTSPNNVNPLTVPTFYL